MDVNLTGSATQVVALEDESQIGRARRTAQQLATGLGFDATDAGRVALIATELASNVLKHAREGAMHLREVPGRKAPGVELIAIDRGAGFNLADCVPDGFSTRGTHGIGLGAMVRLAQVFDMYADARGAVVLARLYPTGADGDYRFGVSQHPYPGAGICGDAWRLAIRDDGELSALIIDGLGHGVEAYQAAAAGAAAFAGQPFAEPEALMGQLNAAMSGSRGGAAAIARFDAAGGRVRYAGIGNIGASLVGGEASIGMASHPGIVGARGGYRRVHTFDYANSAGKLMIMYSDGLQSRWNLADYPGLAQRHPAVVAALLHRDFSRGRDDVTVLAATLGPAA